MFSVNIFFFFFSSRRRHTRSLCDWSSDVCSSDLLSGHRARDLPRTMSTEIEATLDADEERAIRRGRAVPCARASAADVHVHEPALYRELARDRLCERAPTRIAGTDEEQLHDLTHLR